MAAPSVADRALGALGLDREQVGELLHEAVRFVPDTVALLRGVLADDRVPTDVKLQSGAMLAYLVSPVDLVPTWIPVVGQLDDAAVAAFAVRRLLTVAGEPVLREHWRGSERGLQLLLALAAALAVPSRRLRRVGVLSALSWVVRPSGGRRDARPDPLVVDGEVVRRPERD